MCVRVFLAEDSEPVRKAIRILLSGCKDIKVVGEATTFSEQYRSRQNCNLMKSFLTCIWLTAKKSVYLLARNC